MKCQSVILGLFAAVLVSCNGNGENRSLGNKKKSAEPLEKSIQIVKSLRLKSPHRGDLFAFGKPIDVVMIPRKRAADIDSVQFFGDNELLETKTGAPWTWKWSPEKANMGKHNLKLMAYHVDGTIGEVSTHVYLKSNVAPEQYSFEIVKSYPHDKHAYTQGLFYRDGYLYEGTGQNGESSLRKVKFENGEVLSIFNMEQEYFGEGITYCDGKIIQLTWTARKAFVMDPDTFEQLDVFDPKTTNGQGWGITTMNDELVISDGTNVLTFLDPKDYSHKRTIEVYDNTGKVTNLNELEYINGKIFANVWLTDRIVIINPETGRIEGNLNLKNILTSRERLRLNQNDDVLNGIAWDAENNRLFVTGKRWPKLFEIKINKN